MRSFIDEHRLLVVLGVFFVGFFGFVIAQKSTRSTEQSVSASTFRSADTTSPMYKGSKHATTTIIQYSDFLCPSCSVFSTRVMPSIDTNYIQTDKVNFEFRPMAFIAEGSVQAGMGGFCAVDQDKFWVYHDAVYDYVANEVFILGKDPKNDTILTAAIIKHIAAESGLQSDLFNSCLDTQKYLDDITDSTELANRNGVTGTPYVMVDGQVYQGNMTLAAFEALVKAKL